MAVPRRAVGGAGRGGFDVTAHSPHRLSSLTYLPQEDHASIFYYSLKLYGALKVTEIYQHTFARLKVH